MNYYPDLLTASLKIFAVLAVMTVVLISVLYVVKKMIRNGPAGAKGRYIKVLDTRYIGPRKTVTLIEVHGVLLVLGVTHDNIQLLAKMDAAQRNEINSAED